jgi:hypothetical protein
MVLSFILLLALAVVAQNSSLPSHSGRNFPDAANEPPSVEEILSKYLQAVGGAEALQKLSSYAGKGSFTSTKLKTKGPVELYAKAPNKQLMILLASGYGNYRRGFDGAAAWEKTPGSDSASIISVFSKPDADFYRAVRMRQTYPALAYKGVENVAERAAYVLEAPSMKWVKRWYFDAQTGLLLRTETRTPAGKILNSEEYADYRPVDGVEEPFFLKQVDNDGIDFNIRLDNIKHNIEIPDHSFERPMKEKSAGESKVNSPKGRPEVRFTSGQSSLNIPFKDDDGVVLPVRINNAGPFTLSIDSGSGVFGIITLQRAEALGLKPRNPRKESVIGGDIEVSSINGAALSVPGVEMTNRRFEVISLDAATDEGEQIDGALGHDFLKEFVVEIDFERKILNLYDPATYHYTGHGEIIPLKIKDSEPSMMLKMVTDEGQTIAGRFKVDTGLGGTLAFFTPSAKKYGLLTKGKTIEAATSVEVGGEYHRRIGRAQSLQLGNLIIDKPTVSFSEDTEGAASRSEFDGVLGVDILRRFKVILDYRRRRMILEPNSSFKAPFEEDMSGLALDPDTLDHRKVFKVRQVLPGTPATDAGVRKDDLLIAINGRPAAEFTQRQIERMFMEDGREYVLTLQRDGKTVQVPLKLRRLI